MKAEQHTCQREAGKRAFARVRLKALLCMLAFTAAYFAYDRWEGPPPPTRRIEAFEWPKDAEYLYPEAVARSYSLGDNEFPYLVQEPPQDALADAPGILIYMHGAGSIEVQGMGEEYYRDDFKRLRGALADRNWIYVSPRTYEYTGLLVDLRERYGEKPIYLAGMSAGGADIFSEASEYPARYSGLVALCPAVPPMRPRMLAGALRRIEMPVYLVSGEKDGMIAPVCRDIARRLNKQGTDLIFVEVIDGSHKSPPRVIDWGEALNFVSGTGDRSDG